MNFPLLPVIPAIIAWQERSCGGCRACCYGMAVDDIPFEDGLTFNKPVFTPCVHECAAGCVLHGTEQKPSDCVHYHCVWKVGMIKEREEGGTTLRPDKLGLVVDLVEDGPPEFGGFSVAGREVWPNARTQKLANQFIRAVATRLPIGIRLHPDSTDMHGRKKVNAVNWQGYQLYGPKKWISRYQEFTIKEDGKLLKPISKACVIAV